MEGSSNPATMPTMATADELPPPLFEFDPSDEMMVDYYLPKLKKLHAEVGEDLGKMREAITECGWPVLIFANMSEWSPGDVVRLAPLPDEPTGKWFVFYQTRAFNRSLTICSRDARVGSFSSNGQDTVVTLRGTYDVIGMRKLLDYKVGDQETSYKLEEFRSSLKRSTPPDEWVLGRLERNPEKHNKTRLLKWSDASAMGLLQQRGGTSQAPPSPQGSFQQAMPVSSPTGQTSSPPASAHIYTTDEKRIKWAYKNIPLQEDASRPGRSFCMVLVERIGDGPVSFTPLQDLTNESSGVLVPPAPVGLPLQTTTGDSSPPLEGSGLAAVEGRTQQTLPGLLSAPLGVLLQNVGEKRKRGESSSPSIDVDTTPCRKLAQTHRDGHPSGTLPSLVAQPDQSGLTLEARPAACTEAVSGPARHGCKVMNPPPPRGSQGLGLVNRPRIAAENQPSSPMVAPYSSWEGGRKNQLHLQILPGIGSQRTMQEGGPRQGDKLVAGVLETVARTDSLLSEQPKEAPPRDLSVQQGEGCDPGGTPGPNDQGWGDAGLGEELFGEISQWLPDICTNLWQVETDDVFPAVPEMMGHRHDGACHANNLFCPWLPDAF